MKTMRTSRNNTREPGTTRFFTRHPVLLHADTHKKIDDTYITRSTLLDAVFGCEHASIRLAVAESRQEH